MVMSKAGMIRGDNEIVQTTIDYMASRIDKPFQPHRIMLFDSQARGTPDYHSDLDLLVVMEDGTDKRDTAIEIRRTMIDSPVTKDIAVTTPDEIERRGNMVGRCFGRRFAKG